MQLRTSGRRGDFIAWEIDASKEEIVLTTPNGTLRIAYDDLFDIQCALESADDAMNGVDYSDEEDQETEEEEA